MCVQLRNHIEKIVSLADDEFGYIRESFQAKSFKKHQIIIHKGSTVPFDYYIVRGLMRSYYSTPDGKDHIIQFAMEDCWITDPQAFSAREGATLSLDCLEDTTVLALSLENKEKLCHDFRKMEYFFLKKATENNITLQKRIQCFVSGSANDRYHNVITQYPGLIQRIPKSMLASYLGVSRETLSRLPKGSV